MPSDTSGYMLSSMFLESGDCLQWDEFDTTTLAAHTPSNIVTNKSADFITRVWFKFAGKLEIQLE